MFADPESSRATRAFIRAVALLVVGTLVPFVPNFVAGTIPYEDDLANYFWPVMRYVAEQLRSGHLPLWTPDLYAGFPLLADPEAGTFFPLNWLMVLWPEPHGLLLLLVLTAVLSALAMFLFVRQLGGGDLPAIIAAWIFALGGFATGHRVHISIGNSVIMLPLLLFVIDRAVRVSGRRQLLWLLAGAFVSALQWLGGHVQPVLLTWLLAGPYLFFRLFISPLDGAPRRPRLHRMLLLLGVPIVILPLSLGLAAVQLLPTYELSQHSARMLNNDARFGTTYSFPPYNLITFIWPYFFQHQSGVRWGLWNNWETAAYVGILPLIVAAYALARGFTRKLSPPTRRLTLFFGLIALLSMWLAMADYLPLNLHQWLYLLPLPTLLRAPARFMLLFDVALAVLAAVGMQALLAAHAAPAVARAKRKALVVPASACALIAVNFVFAGWIGANRSVGIRWFDEVYRTLPNVGLPYPATRLFDFFQWSIWLGNPQFAFGIVMLIAAALWFALTYARRWSVRAAQVALVLLVSIDLGVFAASFWQSAPLAALNLPDASTQSVRAREDGTRVFSWPHTGAQSDRFLRWAMPDAGGYSSLEPKRVQQVSAAIVSYSNRLLDMAHVGWTLVPPMPRAEPPRTYDVRTPLLNLASTGAPRPQRTFVRTNITAVTSLRLVSALEYAPQVPQGATVARVIVRAADGRIAVLPIRAGIETAEWALQRDDVKAIAQHSAAPSAYTFGASDDFSRSYWRHLYQADLPLSLDGSAWLVSDVEFEVTDPQVSWLIFRGQLLRDGQSVEVLDRFQLANFEVVSTTATWRLCRNRTVLPRAWLVSRAAFEPSGWKLLRRMTQPQFDPEAEVLLEDSPADLEPKPAARDLTARVGGTARIAEESDERVRVQVQTSEDAYLVLADTWYEGWQARDNGVPTKMYRANYLYRAVFVRAGEHELEFTFEPQSVRVGLHITLASMVCVGILGLWASRRMKLLAH